MKLKRERSLRRESEILIAISPRGTVRISILCYTRPCKLQALSIIVFKCILLYRVVIMSGFFALFVFVLFYVIIRLPTKDWNRVLSFRVRLGLVLGWAPGLT